MALTARAGGARRRAVPLGGLGLPERRLPAVGRVAEHRPHGRAVPHRLALPGAHAALSQPPSELPDRGALLDVAGEHLADDLRLELVDFPVRITMLCFLDVPVSVRRARHHRHRAAASAMQLPTTGALGDLRALIMPRVWLCRLEVASHGFPLFGRGGEREAVGIITGCPGRRASCRGLGSGRRACSEVRCGRALSP